MSRYLGGNWLLRGSAGMTGHCYQGKEALNDSLGEGLVGIQEHCLL